MPMICIFLPNGVFLTKWSFPLSCFSGNDPISLRSRLSNLQFPPLVDVRLIGRQLRQLNVICPDNLLHELLVSCRGSSVFCLEIIHAGIDLLQNQSVLRSEHRSDGRGDDTHRVTGVASGSVLSFASHSRCRCNRNRVVCALSRLILCRLVRRHFLWRRVILNNRGFTLPFVLRLCQITSVQKERTEKYQRKKKKYMFHCCTEEKENTIPPIIDDGVKVCKCQPRESARFWQYAAFTEILALLIMYSFVI